MVINKFALIAPALLFVASCDFSPEEPIPTSIEIHNGLRFSLPEDDKVTLKDSYILIESKQPHYRFTNQIKIWFVPPKTVSDGEVTRGRTPAPYTLIRNERGMGGPTYILTIPKHIGNRDIIVQAQRQVEWGKPYLEDVWALWESLEVVTEDATEDEN